MVYCEVKHKHRHGREQDQYTIFAPFANEQRQFTISNTIVKSKPCCKKKPSSEKVNATAFHVFQFMTTR